LRKSRLAFIEKIAAAVPSHRPLFAAPELRNTDRIVIAYRLGRKIDSKPMISANQEDYFLSPSESIVHAGIGTRVLAVSEIDKITLVTAIRRKSTVQARVRNSSIREANSEDRPVHSDNEPGIGSRKPGL
jgi:hypothetical protein